MARNNQHGNANPAKGAPRGFAVLLILSSCILLYAFLRLDWENSAHTIAFRTSRLLSRTSTIYKELGITCEPADCEGADILRNVTQLSADELETASTFINFLSQLSSPSKTLDQEQVSLLNISD